MNTHATVLVRVDDMDREVTLMTFSTRVELGEQDATVSLVDIVNRAIEAAGDPAEWMRT